MNKPCSPSGLVVAWLLLATAVSATPGCSPDPAADPRADAPAPAPVETVPAVAATRPLTVTGFGTVSAAAAAQRAVSVAFESEVVEVRATAGERVEAGRDVLVVRPSADAGLALTLAQGDAKAAEETLAPRSGGSTSSWPPPAR